MEAIWNNTSWSLEIKNSNKQRKIKCTINFNKYQESILNEADPVLKEGLVAVKIDKDTGKVTKADTTKEWYSYENKEWANAVILANNKTAEDYLDDEEILEEDIESYFVWIPKYSYQLWDLGEYDSLTKVDTTKPHTIPIKFGLTNTSDEVKGECTTPMNEEKTQGLAGSNGSCQVGDFMTHPAFISFGVNGLWIGKFETGYKDATTEKEARVDSNNVSQIIIKPNVYSWRSGTVGNKFDASYRYQRDLDSHMIKNTEWGAITYLTHSVYGRCNEITCDKVRVNNNSNYITGYATTEEPTITNNSTSVAGNRFEAVEPQKDKDYTINYLNSKSVLASTTGNYTGIYDMSGGANEYVMGYSSLNNTIGGKSNITTMYEDFFENKTWDKYYDKYSSKLTTDNNNRILGDATGELGPFEKIDTFNISSWDSNYALFAAQSVSWFSRGGRFSNGISAGIFAYNYKTGATDSLISFRIVLAPQ